MIVLSLNVPTYVCIAQSIIVSVQILRTLLFTFTVNTYLFTVTGEGHFWAHTVLLIAQLITFRDFSQSIFSTSNQS